MPRPCCSPGSLGAFLSAFSYSAPLSQDWSVCPRPSLLLGGGSQRVGGLLHSLLVLISPSRLLEFPPAGCSCCRPPEALSLLQMWAEWPVAAIPHSVASFLHISSLILKFCRYCIPSWSQGYLTGLERLSCYPNSERIEIPLRDISLSPPWFNLSDLRSPRNLSVPSEIAAGLQNGNTVTCQILVGLVLFSVKP